jgi:site-specific DNA-methyltransferase (adenine-specific)
MLKQLEFDKYNASILSFDKQDEISSLEKNKFHLIDVVDGLKSIDNNSVDIIIIDPPYNIGKDFGVCKDKLELNQYLNWCDKWISESIRILKSSGSIFIYGFSEILAYISTRIELPKRWLIWHYTNKAVPTYNGWQRSHESILYIWKDKPIFNKDSIRIPYSETFLKNAAGKKRTCSNTARFGSSGETIYKAHEGGALPRDVFEIPALAGGSGRERYFLYKNVVYPANMINDFPIEECIKHPTQKPFKLTEKLLLSAKSSENCFVVIPFSGSGSEGIVCKRLNLNFIGFDINPDYVKMSNLVLEKYREIF